MRVIKTSAGTEDLVTKLPLLTLESICSIDIDLVDSFSFCMDFTILVLIGFSKDKKPI